MSCQNGDTDLKMGKNSSSPKSGTLIAEFDESVPLLFCGEEPFNGVVEAVVMKVWRFL